MELNDLKRTWQGSSCFHAPDRSVYTIVHCRFVVIAKRKELSIERANVDNAEIP